MKNKTTLNFWVMPNAGFATREILQSTIREFEQSHPQVQVRLTIHPWSLAWNRLMDLIKGRYLGPKPDVLQVGTTHVATLAFLGALEKVPNAQVLPDEDKMSAYIWDPGAQGEKGQDLFCVPWFIDIRVLYYRRDIFERLNISPESLQDWKGFYQACGTIQQFIRRSGSYSPILAPLAIPGQKPGVLMHDLAPWIWGAGGDFCSEDLSAGTLNSVLSLKGIEFYFDLIQQGFMPLPEGSIPPGNFFTGHYAMQFSGSWPGATYLNPAWAYSHREVADNAGVALFPSGPQGRFTFLGGSNLSVSAMSEKKTLAWELVRFLSDPSRQLAHARSIGALTARLASLEELFADNVDAKKVFWDSFGHARRLPRLVELGSVEQIIYKAGLKILASMRVNAYSHKVLQSEINQANDGIGAVLSLHRYGAKAIEAAA